MTIEIADWSPFSAEKFRSKASDIRRALGDAALRIDHIGSTAIEGMAAKPIIDMQVSVAGFEPFERLLTPLNAIGYVWRQDNPDLAKRYFRESPGQERTHIHIRRFGSWHEQWALLFRDYMRAHAAEHPAYIALKLTLAAAHGDDRQAYTLGKADYLWAVIRRADRWAAETGWTPPQPDA
jgi:GrpB-like predicted nucleotidyltransferase (UPF0157 family)